MGEPDSDNGGSGGANDAPPSVRCQKRCQWCQKRCQLCQNDVNLCQN